MNKTYNRKLARTQYKVYVKSMGNVLKSQLTKFRVFTDRCSK